MIRQADHVRPARGLGIDDHGIRVRSRHLIDGALAINAERILAAPQDPAGQRVRDQQAQARTDPAPRRHHHHALEHAGHPQHAAQGDPADPIAVFRVLDLFLGPVARIADDDGEARAVGFGDRGERVPFFQRGVGDPDAEHGANASVIEVDADGVAREDFWPGLYAPESKPGQDDEECDGDEHPEGGGLDEDAAEGH